MPVREAPDGTIYRAFQFGELIRLYMLDTRIAGREPQFTGATAAQEASDRQLLGADQERWLFEALAGPQPVWTLLGQQVMMGALRLEGVALNPDQWDGYPAARQRLFETVLGSGVQNLVVLTGDIHSSWAIELAAEQAAGGERRPVGVEVVTPGITSPGLGSGAGELIATVSASLPHIRWADLSRRGFCVVSLHADRMEAEWHLFDTLDGEAPRSVVAARWRSMAGSRVLERG
jgi:alkaline phosphatase D